LAEDPEAPFPADLAEEDFADEDLAELFAPDPDGFAVLLAADRALPAAWPPEPARRARSRSPAAATVWPALIAISGARSATFFATDGVLSATASAAFFTATGALAVAFRTADGVRSATFFTTDGARSATFFATWGAIVAALPRRSVAVSASFLPRSFICDLLVTSSFTGSNSSVRKRTLYPR
jgi:hypothetical protein